MSNNETFSHPVGIVDRRVLFSLFSLVSFGKTARNRIGASCQPPHALDPGPIRWAVAVAVSFDSFCISMTGSKSQVNTGQDEARQKRGSFWPKSQLFGYGKIHRSSLVTCKSPLVLLGLCSKKMSRVQLPPSAATKKEAGMEAQVSSCHSSGAFSTGGFGQEVARTRLGPPPQAYLSSLAVGPLNCLSSQSQSWSHGSRGSIKRSWAAPSPLEVLAPFRDSPKQKLVRT